MPARRWRLARRSTRAVFWSARSGRRRCRRIRRDYALRSVPRTTSAIFASWSMCWRSCWQTLIGCRNNNGSAAPRRACFFCCENNMSLLFAETMGDGPELVLLHGWGLHSGIFEPIRAELTRQFRVTFIDLPGFGQSAAPTEPYSLAMLRDQV